MLLEQRDASAFMSEVPILVRSGLRALSGNRSAAVPLQTLLAWVEARLERALTDREQAEVLDTLAQLSEASPASCSGLPPGWAPNRQDWGESGDQT